MTNYKQIAVVIIGSLVLLGALAFATTYQSGSTDKQLLTETKTDEPSTITSPLTPQESVVQNETPSNTMNPIVTLTTNKGVIKLELYQDLMPITAGNFAKLVSEGYYNDTKFHRVIDGFMIQGGDPNTKSDDVMSYGTGGPGYAITDEFVTDEKLTNVRGTIAMANSGPNTGGSQFFINLVDNSYLDFDKPPLTSKHPVFGRIVDGMDVIDAIAKVETGARDIPVDDIVVESATIDAGGE